MDELKTYKKVNRQNFEMDFGISKMEEIYAKHGGVPDEPHRHSFYTVLLIEKAKGVHKIDFNSFELKEKQAFFISPGQVHQLIEEQASKGFSIVFSIDFLIQNHIPVSYIEELNLFRDCGDSPPLQLSHSKFERLKSYASSMLEFYDSIEHSKFESIGALLKLFLIACHEWCDLSQSDYAQQDRKSGILRDFKSLVETNHRQWHKTKEYANALNLSPDHLNRVIKELTGTTAKAHIQNRLMVAAKRLLYFSELSQKEIAYELGFDDPSNFSSFFKAQSGESPSAFSH